MKLLAAALGLVACVSAIGNPTVSVETPVGTFAESYVSERVGNRENAAERWEVMPLEAEPVLATTPRTHGVGPEANNLVMRFDFAHRMKVGDPVHPQLSSIERLCTPEYSISFWLDVNDATGDKWRTVFYKGDTKGVRSPAMFLHPVTKRLQFHQTVGTAKNPEQIVFSSKNGIPLYTPVHVAVVRRLSSIEIYINGQLDARTAANMPNLCNIGPVHVNPAAFGLEKFTGRMRNFKWFAIAVSPNDVKRLNFEGVENTVVHLDYRKHYSGSSEDGDVIPADESLNTQSWTIATWVMLTELPPGIPQRVFQKGATGHEHGPSLTVLPGENKVSLRLNTELYRTEGLLSPEPLRRGQPTHIAAVKEDNILRLYMDGALAKEIRLSSKARFNDGPLYIARSSSSSSHNGISGFLESFRWYDRALTGGEVRELTVSSAPRAMAEFTTDRSEKVSAIVFPDTPKLRTKEMTIEFWIKNLSNKIRSAADNRDEASQARRNDKEADSQDDDRVRSEEELIADETAPVTMAAVDPDVAALTKREADEEEDADEQVQSANANHERLPPPTAADALKEARRRVAAAYDKDAEAKFAAYDREHMGDFDDDVSAQAANEGFTGLNGGDSFGDDGIEDQENAEVIAEIARQKKLKVKSAEESDDDASTSGDDSDASSGDGSGDDSDASNTLTGGYRGVTGLRAKKASVIANHEDQVTGYGDEDAGRARRSELLRDAKVRDPARAVPRSDEDGTHLWDDDMRSNQKPDEDGVHTGDVIDDNQVKIRGDRTDQDGDIDPYLYGKAQSGGARLNPSRRTRGINKDAKAATREQEEARTVFEAHEAKAMLNAGLSGAEAARVLDARASGADGSVPAEILLELTHGSESARRSLLGSEDGEFADIGDLDSAGAAASVDGAASLLESAVMAAAMADDGISANGAASSAAASTSTAEPANPIVHEMNDKERSAPVVPSAHPPAVADADDKTSGDARRDFVTSEDGEEAIDEPATEAGNESSSERRKAGSDSLARAKAALEAAEGNGAKNGEQSQRAQHLEPDDADEAERYVTGTTNVPGKDGSEVEDRDDKDEDDEDDSALDDEEDKAGTEEESEAEAEEVEDNEEDEAGHVETESVAPRGTGVKGGRMYDESYIGGRVGTPGRRPSETTSGKPKAPAKEDVEETKEDDSEADYKTGRAPKTIALVRKGASGDEFTPTIRVNPDNLHITGHVSLRGKKGGKAKIASRTALFATKPNHVAMTINGRVLRLYINGVLDSERRLRRRVKMNRGPLRIARGLRRLGVLAHMSDVKVHPRALRREELRQVQYSKSIPLRAYYNELVGDHLYSSRSVMKGVDGYRYLGIKGWVQSHPVPGSVPMYRYYNPAVGNHRYAIESLKGDEAEGYFYSGIVGYVYTQYRKNTAALIEYYNPLVGDHFYTTDAGEIADSFYAGYRRVGTVAYVEVNRVSAIPAYRLYDRQDRPSAAITANFRGDLDGKKNIRLLSSELSASAPFTVMAWVKVFDDAIGEPRVVFRKGTDLNQQTPSMYLGAADRKATIKVSTKTGVQSLVSKSELPLNALVHVCVTYDGSTLSLALNGRRDSAVKLDGAIVHNKAALVFGASDRPLKDGVGFRGRVRDIRWFQRAVSAAELERSISVTSDRPALRLSYAPQFDEETGFPVPHQAAFVSREYSLFMSLEPTADCDANACRVLSKGGQPSVAINARGQLVVGVATTNGTTTLASKEALELKQPVSVAVVYESGFVYLYLDGNLDGAAKLAGAPQFTTAPLTVGARGSSKGFTGYLTEVAWYRRAFAQAEIVARADHRNPPVILSYERKQVSQPRTSVTFPHRRQFNTVGATVTFWLKLLHHTDFTTALVTKGAKATEANPAVLLRKDGRIMVLVQTEEVIQAAISTSKIPLNYPTHIAVSRAGRTIKIFINGREDAFHVSAHPFKFNEGGVTVGKIGDVPSTMGWIRGFQWHDYAMERDHVDRTLRDTMH